MSTDDASVERGSVDDVAAVKALIDANWREIYGPIIGLDTVEEIVGSRHASDLLAGQTEDEDALFLVIRTGERIVGHAYAVRRDDHVYLDRLHIAPALRGGGYGTRLMMEVERWAGEGVPVRLEVLSGNDAAIGYYQAIGFTAVCMTPDCGGLAGIPAHVMEKRAR